MDPRVYEVQCWLNGTYGTQPLFPQIDTDGISGYSTIRALIRALQLELGVIADGVWGTSTENAFVPLSMSSNTGNQSIRNQVKILQGALYCKGQGLNPGGFDGLYGNGTYNAVTQFQTYAGLPIPNRNGIASALIMKALLNMDAYTLLENGDSNIRIIQQSLNQKYWTEIGLIPCNGVVDRKTATAMIKGLQVEERKEYPNTTVDGIWGNMTMNRCPTLYRNGTITNNQYVYLLQYALYLNGYNPNGFDGGFGNGVETAVRNFQTFAALTSDGIVGKRTWASLMVSHGDQTRVGNACDCMTPLTESTAQLLIDSGKTVVGRYICGGVNKQLTNAELDIILDKGLEIFPIFQLTANTVDYFQEWRGTRDAILAYNAMTNLSLPINACIYFAVDFDATIDDCISYILPYFAQVKETMMSLTDNSYCIGIYGPRYVCTLVAQAGYASSSFVCDMSSGFSCNIGYKLPSNWEYDQISNLTLSGGGNSLEIDNNIVRTGSKSISERVTQSIDPVKKRKSRVFAVLRAFNLDRGFIGSNFAINQTYVLAQTGLVRVELETGLVAAYHTNAPLSYTISSGVMPSNFNVALNAANTMVANSGLSLQIQDFQNLALEAQAGKISFSVTPGLAQSVISFIVDMPEPYINGNTSILSVTIRFIVNQINGTPSPGFETVYSESFEASRTYFLDEWGLDATKITVFTGFALLALLVITQLSRGLSISTAALSAAMQATYDAMEPSVV